MANKIEVLDAIMGAGKTQGIIQWMLERQGYKFLYVSPLLTEAMDRIPDACESLQFTSPNTVEHKTKSLHLLELLEEGANVSFTHSLFKDLTSEHLRLIELQGYVLIIDEEMDFVEAYQGKDYSKRDILTLEKSGHLCVDEDNLGRVRWTWDDEKYEGGNYDRLKRMCDLQMLHCAKRDREMMVTHLPIALITSARRVIVLTYLYENSVMSRFMRMKGVGMEWFTEAPLKHTEAEIKARAARNIEIIRTKSMDKIRNLRLSSSWYTQESTKAQLKGVENAILSVCRLADNREDVMFTFPKHLLPSVNKRKNGRTLRIKGFVDESKETYWVFCGTRATNIHSHKKMLIHAFNRYATVPVSAYLSDYGFPIKEDEYALSELLQWTWRSNIRNPKGKIKLAILSPRMEKIFTHWLDGNDDHLE